MSTHAAKLDAQSLLADILDTEQSANTICARHAISYQQLIDFLDAPLFTQFTNAAQRLSQARTKLLTLETSPRALEALIETTTATEETRAVCETIRKSATKILTIARQSTRPPPKQAEPKPKAAQPNTPIQTPPPGGIRQRRTTPAQSHTPINYHIPTSGYAIPSSTRAAKIIAAAGSTHTNLNPQPEPHPPPESRPVPP